MHQMGEEEISCTCLHDELREALLTIGENLYVSHILLKDHVIYELGDVVLQIVTQHHLRLKTRVDSTTSQVGKHLLLILESIQHDQHIQSRNLSGRVLYSKMMVYEVFALLVFGYEFLGHLFSISGG